MEICRICVEFSSNLLYNSSHLAPRRCENWRSFWLQEGGVGFNSRRDIASHVFLKCVSGVGIDPGVLKYGDTGV